MNRSCDAELLSGSVNTHDIRLCGAPDVRFFLVRPDHVHVRPGRVRALCRVHALPALDSFWHDEVSYDEALVLSILLS